MKNCLLVGFALACACGSEIMATESPLLHKPNAVIRYTLPADGCSWTVQVGESEYAPDDTSLVLVRAFAHDAYGETPASIDYRLTGRTRQVECGWNTSRELPEISVERIAAP